MSPLLDLPGAVAGNGIDADVAAHYGSFNGEQRTLEAGEGFVDLSHRDVIRVEGPDRLTWLHSLTTQHLTDLPPRQWTGALILSPQGHVEHAFFGYDDGEAFVAHTEPGHAAALVEFLDRMRFMMRVEVTDVTDDLAVTWRPRPPGGRGARSAATSLETPGSRRAQSPSTPTTSSSPATSSSSTPRPPAPPAACGPSRRSASPAASPAWASTPTTAPSPTRSAGSARPCTSTRAATAARRRWPACTRSAARRAG